MRFSVKADGPSYRATLTSSIEELKFDKFARCIGDSNKRNEGKYTSRVWFALAFAHGVGFCTLY
jgi:hypothetical protein